MTSPEGKLPSSNLLEKHYSTIGIHDVFLSPSPHPLLSKYLKEGCQEDFESWEIIGDIKRSPEDFVVREVFQTDKKFPGLSEEEMESLRVADLVDPSKLAIQNLKELVEAKKAKGDDNHENEGATNKDTQAEEKKDFIIQEINTSNIPTDEMTGLKNTLETYLQRAITTPKNNSTQDLVASLQHLHRIAQERINSIVKGGDQTVNFESNVVWIPPFDSDSIEQNKVERGKVFRALKTSFPLLKPESVTKNETEKWIRIQVDDSCDALIEYLYNPIQDLTTLLLFQKRGIDWVRHQPKTQDNEKKGLGDARDSVDTSNQIVLALRTSISKDDRRKIHHLIASMSKNLATSTINDFPLQGEEASRTTVAIVVSWQKHVFKRGNRKRKRTENVKVADPFPNVLCVIQKRQKEHLAMIQRLTKSIGCRQSDIGLAGIKDMQAVTYQFCTFRNMKTQRILSRMGHLENHGIKLGNFFRVDWMLHNGELEGNQFEIRICNLKRICVKASNSGPATESQMECKQNHMKFMIERIQREGFVNFFGTQRLGAAGETGTSAFLIGKAMIQKNFKLAIDLLMVGREHGEHEVSKKVRKIWKETYDPNAALKALGSGDLMPRERAVLQGLKRYGNHLKALQCLPHSIRIFWINAYQSFIWNQIASKRIEKYGTKVIKGDLYVDKDFKNLTDVKVVQDESIIPTLSLDQVVLPLPGYRVQYPENDIGDMYNTLLVADKVKFEKSAPVEATAKGSYRRLIVRPGAVGFEMDADQATVDLRFQLPKGSYATMLLRELMLTTATRNNSAY